MTPGTEPVLDRLACGVCGTAAIPGANFCFHCGSALDLAGAESEAERRLVTVLFGDLSDFTSWAEERDPERVGVVTGRVLAALAGVVGDYGGHVDKLTGDGIMAVFGAPTTHEDDAERAVRAAWAMQDAVRELVRDETDGGRRLGLRVGLNTGEVLAGVQAALSYTVVGDTVNTASRLSDVAAVGTAVAGRETALATLSAATWRALPPQRLKGKRAPVQAYELAGLRTGPPIRLGLGEQAPYVGRDAELGVVIGVFLAAAETQTPRGLVVTGEAGIGVTRLVTELGRFAAELPDTRVLYSRSTPFGQGRDLGPLAEMVRGALGVGDREQDLEARVRRAVSRLEHPTFGEWGPAALTDRLLVLLGLSETDDAGPRAAVTPGEAERSATVAAVEAAAALFSLLAVRGPVLLVVDDLHAATEALLDALALVAERVTGPVLIAGAGRQDLLRPRADGGWWQRWPELTHVSLDPLNPAASGQLLQAYLGGGRLEREASSRLLARAEGNPFFLAELLNLLVDRGVLRHSGSPDLRSTLVPPAVAASQNRREEWELTGPVPEHALPAGVQAVLAARIDALDPAVRAVLRDAALFGVRFPAAALSALGHGDGPAVDRALAELAARGLVQQLPETEQRATSHTFVHSLARDVAYAGTPKVERARRHALAARWAARELPASRTEVDAVVGAQAESAADLATEMSLPAADPAFAARGLGFSALARLGHAALQRDQYAGAEALLRRALDVVGPAAPASKVVPEEVAWAEALAGLRRLAEAEEALTPALRASEPGVRAAALVVLGDVRRKAGRDSEAAGALVSALAAAADAGLDRVAGEALRQLGMLDYRGGRLRDAEQRFRESLQLAEQVGDTRGAGWALQHLAWAATTRGDYAVADAALGSAAEVFATLGDTGGLSWCAGTEAFVRVLQGRLAESRDLARGLVPLAEATGERWGVAAVLTIGALASAELGDVDVADREAEQACERFAEAGDQWGVSFATVARGVAARGAGDPQRAVELLEQAVRRSDAGGHTVTSALAHVVLGLAYLDAGELDQAEDAADTAIECLRQLDLEPHADLGARVLKAQVLRARRRYPEAIATLRAAAEADGASLLFPRRQAMAHLAGTLVDAGFAEEGLEVARRAQLVPAEDIRSRVVSLRAMGLALNATGDRARSLEAYNAAMDLAVSTPARGELATTRRALAVVESG